MLIAKNILTRSYITYNSVTNDAIKGVLIRNRIEHFQYCQHILIP